jgi:hypothetical protein
MNNVLLNPFIGFIPTCKHVATGDSLDGAVFRIYPCAWIVSRTAVCASET